MVFKKWEVTADIIQQLKQSNKYEQKQKKKKNLRSKDLENGIIT